MNDIDKRKTEELDKRLTASYRLMNMYSDLLMRYPTLINSEIVDDLCREAEITREEAIAALLSGVFSLDYENEDDRYIIRHLLPKSVRVLDTKKYTENEYYRLVAPEPCKINEWEIRWESYPAYRAAICADVITLPDMSEIAPLGFFTEEFKFPAVLEGGNEWMTLTPVDMDTVEEAINEAHGRVVTFGLGLGYYTYMVSNKDNVRSVTVVEKSEDVIRLFKEKIFPRFKHPEKVNIVNEDAFLYAEGKMPTERFDYAFVDTWRDASDGLPMYERMKELEPLSPMTKFSYWIENFILSRRRALRFADEMTLIEENDGGAARTYDELIRRING